MTLKVIQRSSGCALRFKKETDHHLAFNRPVGSAQIPGGWATWQSSGGCRTTVAGLPPQWAWKAEHQAKEVYS